MNGELCPGMLSMCSKDKVKSTRQKVELLLSGRKIGLFE